MDPQPPIRRRDRRALLKGLVDALRSSPDLQAQPQDPGQASEPEDAQPAAPQQPRRVNVAPAEIPDVRRQ